MGYINDTEEIVHMGNACWTIRSGNDSVFTENPKHVTCGACKQTIDSFMSSDEWEPKTYDVQWMYLCRRVDSDGFWAQIQRAHKDGRIL